MTITDDTSLVLLEDPAAEGRAELATTLELGFNLTEAELTWLCDYFSGQSAPEKLAIASFSTVPYFGPRESRRPLVQHLRRGTQSTNAELEELRQYYIGRYMAITEFCSQFHHDIGELMASTVRDSVIYFELDLTNRFRPVACVRCAPQGMLEYALRTGFSFSFSELCLVAKAIRHNMRQPSFWTEGVELPIGDTARRQEQVRQFFGQSVFGSLAQEILDLLAGKLRTNVTGFCVTLAPADTIGTLVVFHSGALR